MSSVQYTFVMLTCLLGIAGTATCSEVADRQGILYYSVGSEVRKVYLWDGKDVSFVKNDKYRAVGVGVSINPTKIYWSNINVDEKTIMRSSAHEVHPEVIVDTGLIAPEILAVDVITGNVYFIDNHKKHLGVCTATGSHCTVILNSSIIDTPGGLVLNPSRGEMFWSDYGKKPSIWTAGMDGSGARVLVTEDLGWPKGLAIDHSSRRLYWINSKYNVVTYIESVNFDGTDRHRHIRMEGKRLRSLAIFAGTLYWNDWNTKKIESTNINSFFDFKTVVNASDLIYDMEIYHSSLKSPGLSNPCNRHKCEEFCLLAPKNKYTCACRLDRVLGSDSRSCSSRVEPFYLGIAAGSKILYYRGETLGKASIDETLTPIRIGRIIGDRRTGNLILNDQFTDSIYHFDPRTNEFRLTKTPVYGQSLGGIDINLRTNVVSWSVTNIRRIDETTLHSGGKWNYTFDDVPLDILRIPNRRRSLVVFKSDATGYRIDWLYFRGPRHPRTMILNLVGPKISMAFDRLDDRVYFADEGTGRIESFRINYDCFKRPTDCRYDRRIVCSGAKSPVSLAIFDRKVYWTGRDSNVLQWVEIGDEYQAIKSKVLPINNDFGIMDIVAVEHIGVLD